MNRVFVIKIQCKDRPGIIAAISGLIKQKGGNVLDLNHHSEVHSKMFFLFCKYTYLKKTDSKPDDLSKDKRFAKLTKAFRWKYNVYAHPEKTRLAIMVSKTDHCLWELMLKLKDNYINADAKCIVSNHADLKYVADQFQVPFYHFPISNSRQAQEKHVRRLFVSMKINTIALARYMQILSPSFIKNWQSNIINVHHGFLPAFKGSHPYHQAWKYGVKIIGATCHYATGKLDSGPIIYQDVASVKTNLTIDEFIETGKDIERKVLVEGLKRHLEKKVFVHEGRTIIL